MRRGLGAALGLLAILAARPAAAQLDARQQEALQWLQKVAVAAQKTSFSGTFVYRNGNRSETSRIVHVAHDGRQTERLEVLDGSPREVIRENDEVRCYLPEMRLVLVEQRSARRLFPALLPAGLAGLGEHYVIRRAGAARIAGFDSQIVRLEPRDGWRYGRQFWVDQDSGLLLKADMFDGRGESLESMAFTELRIGPPPPAADAVRPRYAGAASADWQVRQNRARDLRETTPWQFRAELPGFRRQAAMQRQLAGADGVAREALHWVFSDGLAALSVFISPLGGQAAPPEAVAQVAGGISVVKRVIDGHLVVVMGDVPPASVRHFADGIGAGR